MTGTAVVPYLRLMGIILVTSIIAVGTGVFLASRMLPNLAPGEKRVQQDIQELREALEEDKGSLVRLDREGLELLAAQETSRKTRRGFKKLRIGAFSTIYDEPILVYALRQYLSNGPDSLLLANTAQHELIYWVKKKETRVVVDNAYIGLLTPDDRLLGGPKNREELAAIRQNASGTESIWIGEREVATLAAANYNGKPQLRTRFFDLLHPDMSREDKILTWVLAVERLILPERKPD
jgi:GAF domain-containing protein